MPYCTNQWSEQLRLGPRIQSSRRTTNQIPHGASTLIRLRTDAFTGSKKKDSEEGEPVEDFSAIATSCFNSRGIVECREERRAFASWGGRWRDMDTTRTLIPRAPGEGYSIPFLGYVLSIRSSHIKYYSSTETFRAKRGFRVGQHWHVLAPLHLCNNDTGHRRTRATEHGNLNSFCFCVLPKVLLG